MVLEKILKAYWVKFNKDVNHPKIHNLLNLAKQSNIQLDGKLEEFFDKVNSFMLECRYPDYKEQFYKFATKEFARNNLDKIIEVYQWLKSMIQ